MNINMDNIKIVKVTPAKSIAHKCTSKLLEVVLNIDHASISKFRGFFGTVSHVDIIAFVYKLFFFCVCPCTVS